MLNVFLSTIKKRAKGTLFPSPCSIHVTAALHEDGLRSSYGRFEVLKLESIEEIVS